MTDLPREAQAAVERAEKATKGPWEPERQAMGDSRVIAPFAGVPVTLLEVLSTSNQGGADADFIAHAREDIPMLAKGWAEAEGKLEPEDGAGWKWRLRQDEERGLVLERHQIGRRLPHWEWVTDLHAYHAILGGSE